VTTPELEDRFLLAWADNVNDTAVVLFLTQTFEDEIVTSWFLVLNQIVGTTVCLHHERVSILTNFALKGLPEERGEVGRRLGLSLDLQPVGQTVQVNESYGSCALA